MSQHAPHVASEHRTLPQRLTMAFTCDRCGKDRILNEAHTPQRTGALYRVVVKGSGSSRRGFIWEIIHSDVKGGSTVKQTSTQSFRTMEDAYSDGAAALAKWNKL
jgi:hypothetical protein